jgi:hypothetical protein
MTKLSNIVDSVEQHICIFGEPYTGKSSLAATTALYGYNVLWISFDKGYSVLFKLPKEAQERIELVRIPDTKDNPVGIKSALAIISGAQTAICEAHGVNKCPICAKLPDARHTTVHLNSLSLDTIIVFDHITQIADSAMQFAIERSILNKEKDATSTTLTMSDKDYFKPGHSQYMMQGFLMNKFLTNIQQLKNHIICIAHVAEVEQEDGAKKLVPLIGSVPYSRNSPKYFDHVICCELKNKEHRFASHTTYNATIISGSRTDIKIEHKENVTLQPFFKGIFPKNASNAEDAKNILTNAAAYAIQEPQAQTTAEDKRAEMLAKLKQQQSKS